MYLYRRYPFIFQGYDLFQLQLSPCTYAYTDTCTYMYTYFHLLTRQDTKSRYRRRTHDCLAKWTMHLHERNQNGPVSAVISQSIVSYLLYLPLSSSFRFFFFSFFFVFVFIVYRRMTTYSPVLYLFTYPEWATAMVYVKTRRRLQFLSDQPWRCSQAFIVKLFCFAFVF